jgi:hypothetical protein
LGHDFQVLIKAPDGRLICKKLYDCSGRVKPGFVRVVIVAAYAKKRGTAGGASNPGDREK